MVSTEDPESLHRKIGSIGLSQREIELERHAWNLAVKALVPALQFPQVQASIEIISKFHAEIR